MKSMVALRLTILTLLVSLVGCVSTSVSIRYPKDVAMARALGTGGDQGALTAYYDANRDNAKWQVAGDTIVRSVEAVTAVFQPWNVILGVSGQWANVVKSAMDVESFKWDYVDWENRTTSIKAEMKYDERGMPEWKMEATLVPEVEK